MGPRFPVIDFLRPAAADRTAFSGGARANGSGDFKTALADASSRGSELKKIANRRSNEPDRADEAREPEEKEPAPTESSNDQTDHDNSPIEVAPVPIQIVSITNGENAAAAAEGKSPSPVPVTANRPAGGEMSGATKNTAKGDFVANGQSSIVPSPEVNKLVETNAPDVTPAENAFKLNTTGASQGEDAAEQNGELPGVQSRDRGKLDVGAMYPSGKSNTASNGSPDFEMKANSDSVKSEVQKPPSPAAKGDGTVSSQIPSDEDQTWDKSAVLQDRAQEQPSDTANVGETAFEEKVRRWIDGRREGSDVKAPARPEANIASSIEKVKPQAGVTKKSGSRFEASVEAATKTGKVKVAVGRGDGAAASLARLLVQGLAQPEASDKNPMKDSGHFQAQSSPRVSEVSPTHSGDMTATSSTSPANIVADLLAATDESQSAVENVAKALTTSGGSGRYQATMRLDPPELGHVKVQIRMQAEAMTLQVQAENHQVSKLIESRLGELRDALAGHGIRIDKAEVTVKTPDTGDSQNQGQQERPLHDGQRGPGEHSQSPSHEGSWSQGGWRETRDGSSRENGTPTWTPGDLTGGIEVGSAGETSTDRWMPILDGSVDLVA